MAQSVVTNAPVVMDDSHKLYLMHAAATEGYGVAYYKISNFPHCILPQQPYAVNAALVYHPRAKT